MNLELLFSRQTASPAPATAATVPLSERLLTRRILILGSGPMAAKVVEEIEAIEGSRDVMAGLVDHEEPQGPWARNTKWLGPPSRLAEIVERVRPHRIVVAVADRRDRLPLQLLLESRVRGVIVEDAVEFYERLTGKMAIEWLNPSSLILSKGFRIHGAAEIVARIVSVIGAAVGLVLAAPLLLAIALAIKLDSRGPVLFIQSRVGRNDRPFGLFKFRTMLPTEGVHSEWARDNTHRITRVGRWLRRFRLDEVPQLVNVLAGEMNLVGPRPHPTSNHEIFMDQIACYPLRSTVRPGVTGWAQIRYGYANDLEEETEKMRYDLFYIKNRSIWLDASILFRTVFIVILGQGATEVKRRTTRHTDMTWSSVRTGTDGAVYAPCLVSSVTRRPSSGRH